jgi:hypothetical protein
MNRGRRRENIFLDAKDYETFIRLLQEADERWDIKIAVILSDVQSLSPAG